MTGWVRTYIAAAICLMAAVTTSRSALVVTVAGVFTGLLAVAAIGYGIRVHRPAKRWIWYVLLLGVLFTSIPKVGGDHGFQIQGPIMVVSAIGNLCFVAAPLLFLRARGGKDHDETFDGWTLTLALAVGLRQFLLAGQPENAVVPQPVVLVLTVMAGITVAASIRLTFMAMRNTSAWLLLFGSIAGQFIGVSLAMVNSGTTASMVGADVLAGLGRLLIGAAAIVPAMAAVTRPAPPRRTLPHARLVLLGVALPIAIMGVFVEAGGRLVVSFAGIGVLSIVVLLIVRMVRLLSERERARMLQELVADLGTKALAEEEKDLLAHVRDATSTALKASVTIVVPQDTVVAMPADGPEVAGRSHELRVPMADAGVLVIRRDRRRFSDDERVCAEAVGVTVSSAVRRYRSEEQIRYASLHDALTGLPNRALFLRCLEEAVADGSGAPVSVLFIDLDRFKSVNDRLGHQAGDELLVAVAGRIRTLLSGSQLLARLAGDEFVVLCPGTAAEADTRGLAVLISARLAEPFPLSTGVAEIGGSVGLATHDGTEDLQQLIHRADTAMYSQKSSGGTTVRRLGAASLHH